MPLMVSQAVERCVLDLERFLEVWPLLTSRDLLQALEACSGKTVSLYVAGAAGDPDHIELLVDCDAQRAAIDTGSGARWGRWQLDASGGRLILEDGSGEWLLVGSATTAALTWQPRT